MWQGSVSEWVGYSARAVGIMARLAPTSRLAHSYVPVAPLTAAAHALPFAPPIPSYRAPLTPYVPLSSASALSAMSYTGQKNVEGQPHGEGRRSFPSGHVYEGQFVNGLQHGRGTFRFPDGQLFEGEWKAGKRHGLGRLTMSDGQVVEGQWVDDEFKGSTKKPTPHEEPLPAAPSLHLRTRHAPPVEEDELPPPPLPSASLAHSGRTEPDYKDFDRLKESHALIWQLNVELQAENVRLVKENRRLRRQVKEISSSYPPHVESRAAHDHERAVPSNHELHARREHPQDKERGEPRRHKPHASRELTDSRRGDSRYHDSYASHEDSSDAEKALRRRARNEKASARLRHRVELERAGFPIEEVAAAESHSMQPYSSKEERHHRAHKSPSKHSASNRDAFHFKKPEPVGDFVAGAAYDDWDKDQQKLTRSRSKESSAENRELEPPWSRRRRVVTEMCDTLIVEIEDELWKADWTPVKLLGAHGEVEGFAKRVLNMQLNPLRSQDPGVFIDDLSLSDSLREAMSAKQAVSCWPEGLNRILTVTESDLQSLLAARELRLNDRMLGGGGGGAMALIMRASTALYVCDLSRNNIGDPGAWALAEALRSNNVLGALYLPENNIGVRGGVAIAEAVGGSRTLRVLDLGRNHLEAAGATAMAKVVQKNRSLTELSLFGNSIGIIGGRAIADAVRVNSTLRSLDLRDNGLDKYTETSLLQVGGGVVILEGDAMRGALSNSMLGSESSHGTLPARYPSIAQPHQGPYHPFQQQNAPGWNSGPDTRVGYPQYPANNIYGDPYQHSPGKHGHYQPGAHYGPPPPPPAHPPPPPPRPNGTINSLSHPPEPPSEAVSFLSWAKSEKPDAGPSQSRIVNESSAPKADSFLSWASKEPQEPSVGPMADDAGSFLSWAGQDSAPKSPPRSVPSGTGAPADAGSFLSWGNQDASAKSPSRATPAGGRMTAAESFLSRPNNDKPTATGPRQTATESFLSRPTSNDKPTAAGPRQTATESFLSRPTSNDKPTATGPRQTATESFLSRPSNDKPTATGPRQTATESFLSRQSNAKPTATGPPQQLAPKHPTTGHGVSVNSTSHRAGPTTKPSAAAQARVDNIADWQSTSPVREATGGSFLDFVGN